MKRRQPNSNYLIKEMIKLEKFEEAMLATDENVDYFEEKAQEQRDLYHEAAQGHIRKRFGD